MAKVAASGKKRGVAPTGRCQTGPAMSTGPLAGKTAVVTGASRRNGIGYAVCADLAAAGADIFFVHWSPYDRTMPWGADAVSVEELSAELESLGVKHGNLAADLRDPSSSGRIFDAAESVLGPISILVNNATHSTHDGYESLDAATLDAHYQVNVRGTLLLSIEFARRFSLGSGGRIISMTTGIANGPMPTELAYSSTKAAVEAFTKSLAPAVAAKGITVNCLNPGVTDTGWIGDEDRERFLAMSPHGRIGTPADAARAVRLLALPDAEWITGQRLDSDGGFLYG